MEIKKTVIILVASCMMYSCATKTDNNPFFTEFQTEYGVPAFDKIKLEHYEPAFLKGIEEQNQNRRAVIQRYNCVFKCRRFRIFDNGSGTL